MVQRSFAAIIICVCISATFPSADHPVTGVQQLDKRVALLVAGEETLREIAARPNRRAVLRAKSLSQER
jgi:hypothetical protein